MGSVMDANAPAKTLLKVHLLPGEEIIAEFVELPVCNSLCRSGTIRRVQLTTHRLSYLEVNRKYCCWTTPVSMRQVFIQDICEIVVDSYRRVDESWATQLFKVIFRLGFPAGGLFCLYLDAFITTGVNDDYYSPDRKYAVIGGLLIAIGLLAILYWLFKTKAPQIIIGTRCPQLPAFSIRLTNASDRIKLLDALSTALAVKRL